MVVSRILTFIGAYDIMAFCTNSYHGMLPASCMHKSVNLEYNTLVRWADGTNISWTKRLMFQVLFFFHKILQNSLQTPFQFIFLSFYKIAYMKIKSFGCPIVYKKLWKKNAWNVRRLVHELFVPSAQRTSVLYCRLSDF